MRYFLFLLTFAICFSNSTFSQGEPTPVEKQKKVKKVKDTTIRHSYKKALWMSAVLPGMGQVYNELGYRKWKGKKHKSWWRVPIIYGALAGVSYLIADNHIKYLNYRNEYVRRVDYGLPASEDTEIYDANALIGLQAQHRKWRDLSIFGLVFVYGLNLLDAVVDAHFVTFDISSDLSLQIQPKMLDFQSFGVGFKFKFR